MRFFVTPGIFEQCPDLLVGVLSCHDVRNPASPPEAVAALREGRSLRPFWIVL